MPLELISGFNNYPSSDSEGQLQPLVERKINNPTFVLLLLLLQWKYVEERTGIDRNCYL